MKVQVTLKTSAKAQLERTISLSIYAVDIVAVVKQRIAAALCVAFPEACDLIFAGEVLDDPCKICLYGLTKGCCLDFVVRATEETLAQQFVDLLQKQDVAVPSAELEMLYAFEHGVGTARSLALLGINGNIQEFLFAPASGRRFGFDAEGCIELAGRPTAGEKQVAEPSECMTDEGDDWSDSGDESGDEACSNRYGFERLQALLYCAQELRAIEVQVDDIDKRAEESQEPVCVREPSAWYKKASQKHPGKCYYVNKDTGATSWKLPASG